jgi:hypothetical protein
MGAGAKAAAGAGCVGLGILLGYLLFRGTGCSSGGGGTGGFCPSGDVSMPTGGTCPSGYMPDPNFTGCCVPIEPV